MSNFIITQLFMGVLSMSLTAALIGLVLTAIRPFTEKYFSQKWNYYIWLLVVVRLAVPLCLETDFLHMLNLRATIGQSQPAASTETIKDILGDTTATASVEIMSDISKEPDTIAYSRTMSDISKNPDIAAPAYSGTLPDTSQKFDADTPITDSTRQDKSKCHSITGKQYSSVFSVTGFLTAAAYLWLFGTIAALFMKLWSYHRFQSAIRKERVHITNRSITYMENTFCTKLGIHKPPVLYESTTVSVPLTIGLRNPVIVFPKNVVCDDSRETGSNSQDMTQIQLILHHELIHVARKDLLYKWVYQVLLCIHWFNPLLRWFGRQINCCCELSCDEAVLLRLTDAGRQMYGNILLDTAAHSIGSKSTAFTTTLLENKKDLKKRLDSIRNHKKRTRFQPVLSVCTLVIVLSLSACSGIRISINDRNTPKGQPGSDASDENNGLLTQIPFPDEAGDMLTDWGKTVIPSDAGRKIYDNDSLIAGDDYPENWSAWLYDDWDPAYGKHIDASGMILHGSLSIVIAYASQDVEIDITSAFDIFEGKFKLVHIAPDGSVTAINESGAESKQTITLKKGRNAIKIAGQDAKVKKLAIDIDGLKKSGLDKVYYSASEEETAQIMDSLKTGAPIDKDKAVRNLSILPGSRNDISEIFHSLLISRAVFTADDFHCFFMYSDRELSAKYLVEAIEDGYQSPPDAESASIILPYMDKQYKVRLFRQLPPETFYDTFAESLPYLDENQIQECLTDYIQKGGALTDADFSQITHYLNETSIKELRKMQSGIE